MKNVSSNIISNLPREECGVVAVIGTESASRIAYEALRALQHRGQDTCGIVSINSEGEFSPVLAVHRGLGLVADVFKSYKFTRLNGESAIGHVRYSTTGVVDELNSQPIVGSIENFPIAVAHNGNITNAKAIKNELMKSGSKFSTTLDSELIVEILKNACKNCYQESEIYESVRQQLQSLSDYIEGAYSIVCSIGNKIFAIRDPYAFRPLQLGKLMNGAFIIVSESVALDMVGARFVRDILPGEVIEFDRIGTIHSHRPDNVNRSKTAHCIFELIYFSRPDSIIDGYHVQQFREKLGTLLWADNPIEADVVIPVPDTGIAGATGFARAAGLPLEMALIRNRYVGRTFIDPKQEVRESSARLKYNPVKSLIENKRVIVIDDSIVRGTTSKLVCRLIRDAGATEIHYRVTSPPWRFPCKYGIDTPDKKDFIAHSKNVGEIEKILGCDSLGYLSLEAMVRAGNEGEGWCTACFNGLYVDQMDRLNNIDKGNEINPAKYSKNL